MQYNKSSWFCASVTDAQNIITHYLAFSFAIKLLNLEKSVNSNRKKFYGHFNFLCMFYLFLIAVS